RAPHSASLQFGCGEAVDRIARIVLAPRTLRFIADLLDLQDVVLSRWPKVVLVHGCFWHRHRCVRGLPGRNRALWRAKFRRNVARDRRTLRALRAVGWAVLVVWECETARPAKLLERLRTFIKKPPK